MECVAKRIVSELEKTAVFLLKECRGCVPFHLRERIDEYDRSVSTAKRLVEDFSYDCKDETIP